MPIIRAGDADIAYEVHGAGDPLLMIMGWITDSRMWMMQTPAFAERYKVITFDNRGVGRSSSPPGPYTMEQMAGDALAVLDAAGADHAHVLGISMGGAIAQHLALKAPERVKTLTLAATWCERNGWMERLSTLGRAVADELGHERFVRATMLWLFTPRLVIEQPDMVAMIEQVALSMPSPGEAFVNQLAAVQTHDVREQLAALDVPALVLSGTRDMMIPPELGHRLAGALPRSEMHLLDAGHAMNFEAAEEFNRRVLDFLGRNA